MLPAILTLLGGMALGQRFKLLVLAPAILLTLVLAVGAGVARADTPWRIGLTAAGLITSLQIGYLLGLGIRHVLIRARAKRMRAASFVSSLPTGRSAH
jgi:hypothetical protein